MACSPDGSQSVWKRTLSAASAVATHARLAAMTPNARITDFMVFPRAAELQTTGTVADIVVRSRAKSQHRIRRFAYVPSTVHSPKQLPFTVRRQVGCAPCTRHGCGSIGLTPP